MAKLVSRTYGDALFQLAVEENRIDTMFEEVRTVAVALQENPDLTRLMNHPKIDKEEKVKAAAQQQPRTEKPVSRPKAEMPVQQPVMKGR